MIEKTYMLFLSILKTKKKCVALFGFWLSFFEVFSTIRFRLYRWPMKLYKPILLYLLLWMEIFHMAHKTLDTRQQSLSNYNLVDKIKLSNEMLVLSAWKYLSAKLFYLID